MGQGRRFHLQQRIGSGAFGEVFLAEQDSGAGFRKRVAIKLLHARLEGTADAGRRFRDEARILGRLSHRHIVTVLDLVQLDERWAVIMDYVPGADLEHVLDSLEKEDGRFPVPAALEAASAICAALDAAFHAPDGSGSTLGVVHRDIKPSNVRLTRDGEIKVLDFGVASVNMETREAETGLHRMGTERYMAPERIVGEDSGTAGDMYAVGTTLAELLLGEPIGRSPVLPDRHERFVDEVMVKLEDRLDGPEEVVAAILASLRSSLSSETEDRPAAAFWCEQLARQARAYPGETLSVFSRRYVDHVSAALGQQAQTVSGILSEGTLPGDGMSLAVGSRSLGAETFVPDDLPPETAPASRVNAQRVALFIGLTAGLIALTLIGVVVAVSGVLTPEVQTELVPEAALGLRAESTLR